MTELPDTAELQGCDGSPSCPAKQHIVGCRRVPPESLDGFAWQPTTAATCDKCYGGWFAAHKRECPRRLSVDWANLIGVPLLGLLAGGVYGWMIFFAGRSQ